MPNTKDKIEEFLEERKWEVEYGENSDGCTRKSINNEQTSCSSSRTTKEGTTYYEKDFLDEVYSKHDVEILVSQLQADKHQLEQDVFEKGATIQELDKKIEKLEAENKELKDEIKNGCVLHNNLLQENKKLKILKLKDYEIIKNKAIQQERLKCLEEIEFELDNLNANDSKRDELCRYCPADKYDGQEIIHQVNCPISRLRKEIKELKQQISEGKR